MRTGTFVTSHIYNFKGDLTQMTYPSGRVVNFNYATGGGCCNSRLASVVDQTTNTTVAASLVYNAAGETTSRTLGNGIVETFAYNNRLQQTTITATLTSTPLMNFTYDYGTSTTNTGRVLSRTDALQPEHSARYFYDSIYRLGQVAANDASTSWGISWTFDVWGNRLTQTPQGVATGKVGTQTLGYVNNRLTTNTYDAAGNQTNDGLHNYTFNAENQITQMDGGTAVYAYDGEGRRTKKTFGSETTYYFYGAGGLLCELSTSNTGATQASSTNRTTYRTSDKLGTAVLLIAASGMVIENNRTLPYGEAWLPEAGSVNDKKFTTYQRDSESGLDYAMNRYDSNANGRFVSVDPVQFPTIKVKPPKPDRFFWMPWGVSTDQKQDDAIDVTALQEGRPASPLTTAQTFGIGAQRDFRFDLAGRFGTLKDDPELALDDGLNQQRDNGVGHVLSEDAAEDVLAHPTALGTFTLAMIL